MEIVLQISPQSWKKEHREGQNIYLDKILLYARFQVQFSQFTKGLNDISNGKFFMVNPYFGGIFKVEWPIRAKKIAHLGIFRHIGGRKKIGGKFGLKMA